MSPLSYATYDFVCLSVCLSVYEIDDNTQAHIMLPELSGCYLWRSEVKSVALLEAHHGNHRLPKLKQRLLHVSVLVRYR